MDELFAIQSRPSSDMLLSYDEEIDWCEPNYVFIPYIAEMFNATTNFIQLIFWICFSFHIYSFREYVEKRHFVLLLLVSVVMMSGIIAHSTCIYIVGAIDEFLTFTLALFMALVMYINYKDLDDVPLKWIIGLIIIEILYIAIVIFFPAQGFIFTLFGQTLQIIAFALYVLVPKFNNYKIRQIPSYWIPLIIAVTLLILALICANVELLFCDFFLKTMNYSIGHSLWHIFITPSWAIAILLIILTRAQCNCDKIENEHDRVWIGINPYFPFYFIKKPYIPIIYK